MSTQQDHEIVPAIRDWLAATTDVELPLGLSREDARERARAFLAAIVIGTVIPDHVDVDDDLKDILWASVEELDEKPISQPTFEECDRFYQFVAALTVENDSFDECDEVLHRVARIGWRSAPGGLETLLKVRAAICDQGDEQLHRQVCESADHLAGRVEALGSQQVPGLAEIHEMCGRLVKLSNVRPSLVASEASYLYALLSRDKRGMGHLDDAEFVRGTAALAAGMAERQLGNWDSTEAGYSRAASAFRRCAEPSYVNRVYVERLAVQYARGMYCAVTRCAPSLIDRLPVGRDRSKAQLVLGLTLIDLDRPGEAITTLTHALRPDAIQNEPALLACVLSGLGNALSYLGKDAEAIANFDAAGEILTRYHLPSQVADLTTKVAEHLGKLGNLSKAADLYAVACDMFEELGQQHFVGYVKVLLAQMLTLLGRNDDAEAVLLAALPLIEKLNLRREGLAAVALLRDAIAKRRIDVTAIQELRDHLRKGLH